MLTGQVSKNPPRNHPFTCCMAEMFGYLQMRLLILVFYETTISDDFVTEMNQCMVLALDCAESPRVIAMGNW